MEDMSGFIMSLASLLEEMAPYLLLGFLIAGILHSFVPGSIYSRYLSDNSPRSILLSLLLGIPLPLCSCGVIPTAVSMRKEGASKGAVSAFLIATPQTGVDSIAATWSVLGLPFAILRPVVALVTGFFGGLFCGRVADREGKTEAPVCQVGKTGAGQSFGARTISALKYGFSDMLQDIGPWLAVGLVIAGLITVLVPDDFFSSYSGSRILNMFLILVVAVPMYVCATGSIPIAAALILKGVSPGAALVFLMAGPATNIASIMVLGRTLGRKSLVAYLVSIIGGAIAAGLVVDWLLPAGWFTGAVRTTMHSACCHENMSQAPWWQVGSSIVLLVLLVRALLIRFTRKNKSKDKNMKTFAVKGMMCNHCKANVHDHIAQMPGVSSVDVDLASGIVTVEGDVDPADVVAMVKSLGYDCSI